MAVAAALNDVAQWAFHSFVAGKVECMGRPRSNHSDVETSQRPEDPLSPDDPFQSLVHTLVLCIWVRLQALHPCLKKIIKIAYHLFQHNSYIIQLRSWYERTSVALKSAPDISQIIAIGHICPCKCYIFLTVSAPGSVTAWVWVISISPRLA